MTVATIQQGIDFARQNGEDELMIIGGGSVYQETIQSADILYVTAVLGDFPEADTFFPEIDTAIWQLVEIADAPADDKNTFAMRFCRYERRK